MASDRRWWKAHDFTPSQAFAVYTMLRFALEPKHRDRVKFVLGQMKADADEILCIRCKERPRMARHLCKRCYYRHWTRLKRNEARKEAG